jgi:molecular chaperone DnaJ
MKNPYDTLGVGKTASTDEIKSAYRKLAKQYHPDLNPNNPSAEAKMKEVNEAYEVLSDDKKRHNFDTFGSAEGRSFGGGGAGGFDFGSAFGGGGFSDIFSSMFGGMGGDFGSAFGGRSARRQNRGNDIHINTILTFSESCLGVKKTVTFTRLQKCGECHGTGARGGSDFSTCGTCSGSGTVRQQRRLGGLVMENMGVCSACNGTGKNIRSKCDSCNGKGVNRKTVSYEVNIPAGIHDGQTINISGEGDAASGGEGISGNLLIGVKVTPHPLLIREEFDLYLELPITFTQAILGDKVQIPTIDGSTLLTIPPNTQSGTTHRLKGRGVKRLRSIGAGDLVVKIVVEIPRNLSRAQIEQIRALEQTISRHEYAKRKAYTDKLDKL